MHLSSDINCRVNWKRHGVRAASHLNVATQMTFWFTTQPGLGSPISFEDYYNVIQGGANTTFQIERLSETCHTLLKRLVAC